MTPDVIIQRPWYLDAGWVGGVGLVIVGMVATALWWLIRRRRPPAEVRPILQRLDRDFAEITASGGRPFKWFYESTRHHLEDEATQLAGSLVNRKLGKAVEEAALQHRHCFANSWVAGSTPEPEMVRRQIAAAEEGQRLTKDAIAILNTAVRRTAG